MTEQADGVETVEGVGNTEVTETKQNKAAFDVKTVKFPVTLANGNQLELEAIADRDDLDLEIMDHAQRGNVAVVLMGALTPKSVFALRLAGAKVRDYTTIAQAYGEAVGALED